MSGPSGIAIIDKPAGWTSHDVVARCRKLLGTKKVGHSGTLDPDATGVLVIGVGRATRLLRFLTGLDKEYVGEVVLGIETASLDASGEVVARHDMAAVTLTDVERVAAAFVGSIEQVPPMVSAIKVGGKRLHELARQGVEVERDPRPVTIRHLAVEPTASPGVYRITVTCSAGTYIRSLAADIGHALGGGAHLRALRRTAVGPFTLAEAQPLAEEGGALDLLPSREGWRGRPTVVADAADRIDVGHGKVMERERLGCLGDGPWGVVGPTGELLAVYEPHRGTTVKPALVLVD